MVGHILDKDATIGMGLYSLLKAGRNSGVGAVRVTALRAPLRVVEECWADLLATEVEGVTKWFVDATYGIVAGYEYLERDVSTSYTSNCVGGSPFRRQWNMTLNA